VFGCDVCQDVCPFNQSKKPIAVDATFTPQHDPTRLAPLELLSLTSAGYRKVVKGTALTRASRTQLQRNAAIALGNDGYEEASNRDAAVTSLTRALFDNRSSEVRCHAAWALGRLGTEAAKKALMERFASEPEPNVQAELRAALERS
jgi:epoxyqueuosine reductase